MTVLVVLVSFRVYRGMLVRSPETAQTTFLYLGIGIGIVVGEVDFTAKRRLLKNNICLVG